MEDSDTIKEDFMTKKSQGKSSFVKFDNYKSRWFLLRPCTLSYHDGTLEAGRGRQKGEIQLSSVRAVEEVDQELIDQRPNCFQIVYRTRNPSSAIEDENFTLYIQATSNSRRQEWIAALRKQCKSCGCITSSHFHPGIWSPKRSVFTCCQSINKRDSGCREITWTSQEVNAPNGATNSEFTTRRQLPLPPEPIVPPKSPCPPPNQRRVLALYSYQLAEPGDLDLVKGEEYILLDNDQQNWWKVKNSKEEVGFVPANYVEEISDLGLEKYEWYYPGVSRTQGEEILTKEGKEGWFIVRDSTTKGKYSLSIFTKEKPSGQVRHYHIKTNRDGDLYLSDQHPFAKIPDLINYHKHNCAGLVMRLRASPSKGDDAQPATAGFGHDICEIESIELVLGEVLGSGQYGTVHRATWRGKQEVAVKMPNEGTMSEYEFIEEARTMMQLQHKNLVQLYGVCSKSRPIYIVTELMKNGALLQYLKKHKHNLFQHPSKLLEMCAQIAEALKYLEGRLFIHRDLAARNCLVGETGVVKVGDFGLARFVLDDTYTSSMNTKFPIKWAAPEVLSYSKFSTKSDVWAFGVLMWEIWTGGEMPHSRVPTKIVVEKICTRRERLMQPRNCPQAVYQMMLRCWEHLAEDRPTFSTLVDDISIMQDKDYE